MNIISLHDWLMLCEDKGIPYIPGRIIAYPTRAALIGVMDGVDSESARHAWQCIQRHAKAHPKEMQRFDCCAGMDLKSAMARGGITLNEERHIQSFDDPRLCDILLEFGRDVVPVWARPWKKMMRHKEYSIEFRVFVDDGQIAGISNYYPQRSLKSVHPVGMRTMLESVRERAESLITSNTLNCSIDFGIGRDALDVVFIEGGPPHTEHGGAHPCCFLAGEIEGVALSNRNENQSEDAE